MFAVRYIYLFLHRGVVGTLPSHYFLNMHSHILLCSGLTLPHPTAPRESHFLRHFHQNLAGI